jgi:nicotinate-nucleotide--dimethylbenzimidazole phosphoribosyltransferase
MDDAREAPRLADAPATDLVALGEGVGWTSFEAAASARDAVDPRYGRLGELVEWLAGAQDTADPRPPARPRCVVFGTAGETARALAAALDVGLREVQIDPAATVADALAQGVSAADDEVDSGADLIVVVDADDSAAPALMVSLLAGVEPVALLPRGAAAIDTAAWIARAEYLRDARRAVVGLRDDPAELLTALGHASLAATAGFVLRASARRTPLVLDGPAAAAAALACHRTQPRSSRWWRFADAAPDPLHARVLTELDQRPLLDLAISAGDGTAGLLTVPLLRAAVGCYQGQDS